MRKIALALLTSALMVATMLPASAFAATEDQTTDPSGEDVVKIPFEKIWEGDAESDRPESITVVLKDGDGAQIGKELVVNADNEWKGDFEVPKSALDKSADGVTTNFTVDEEPVAGYEIDSRVAPIVTWTEFSVGEDNWKIQNNCNQGNYQIEGNVVVIKKGNTFYIWTKDALNSDELNVIADSIRKKGQFNQIKNNWTNDDADYKSGETGVFSSDGGTATINANEETNEVTIDFTLTSIWSMFAYGTYIPESIEVAGIAQITNKLIEEQPEEPPVIPPEEDPGTPEDTPTPVEPSDDPQAPVAPSEVVDGPQTGDDFNLWIFAVASILALIAAAAVFMTRRYTHK